MEKERVSILPNLNMPAFASDDPDVAQVMQNRLNVPKMRHLPTKEETFKNACGSGGAANAAGGGAFGGLNLGLNNIPWVMIALVIVIIVLLAVVIYLGWKLNEQSSKPMYPMRRPMPQPADCRRRCSKEELEEMRQRLDAAPQVPLAAAAAVPVADPASKVAAASAAVPVTAPVAPAPPADEKKDATA